MPSYRLLRNNKESGPYSLGELVKLGLKGYDLVWIEGRSAAWRYPSEVAELKDYAPVVEEQPFDRFFKKPVTAGPNEGAATDKLVPAVEANLWATNKKTVEEAAGPQTLQTETVPVAAPIVKKIIPEVPTPSYASQMPQPAKKVFVSMPESIGFEAGAGSQAHDKSYADAKYQPYLPQSKPSAPKALPIEEKSSSPINIHESAESRLETKYTQSLDDIKEMYINTLVQRKTRTKRKEILRKYVRPLVLPLLLVVGGIAIGFLITNKKNSLQASASVSKVVSPATNQEQKQNSATVPGDSSNSNTAAGDNPASIPDPHNSAIENKTPSREVPVSTSKQERRSTPRDLDKQKESSTPQNEKANDALLSKKVGSKIKEKETVAPFDETSLVQKKNVEVDPHTGERKSVVRDNSAATPDNNEDTKADRAINKNSSEHSFLDNNPKNILELVTVKSNDYVRGTFGGIRGLELTVFNNSNFMLDAVSVQLEIMKPSETPLRTDIITFHNVAANGSVTVKVPDSQRGIRVDYHITNIESKQLQKSTAGL